MWYLKVTFKKGVGWDCADSLQLLEKGVEESLQKGYWLLTDFSSKDENNDLIYVPHHTVRKWEFTQTDPGFED